MTSIGSGVTFFNAPTGDRFDLPVQDVVGYFWTPRGDQFGYLSSSDLTSLFLVDTATGDVFQYALREESLRYAVFALRPTPLLVFGTTPSKEDFLVIDYALRPFFTEDGRYRVVRDPAQAHTQIEEVISHTMIPVTDPDDNLVDTEFAWSPDGSRLVIVQNTTLTGRGRDVCDCTLLIFDLATQTAAQTLKGNFTELKWSPDSARLLFIQPVPEDGFAGALCILTVDTGATRCLTDGRANQGGQDIGFAEWLPDGRRVSYLFWTDDPVAQAGGLCVMEIETGEMQCPTTNHVAPGGAAWIRAYRLSPDSSYLYVSYGCPTCDYDTISTTDALVSLDASGYLAFEGAGAAYALWRP